MAFLTIAAVTVEVDTRGATQPPSEKLGSSARAFAGNLRSTVRGLKRQWRFRTGPITAAEEATLRAFDGSFEACAGDAIAGAPVTCEVTIGDAPYIEDASQAGGFSRSVDISLREV